MTTAFELLLCGSLRQASLNRMLLRCFAARAPSAHHCTQDGLLGTLPLFDADQDGGPRRMPTRARRFRDQVMACDALVVASPEYAHGISGVLKNGLDWLVSDSRFPTKPVLLLDYSPHSVHASAALREVLTTMSARIVGESMFPVPVRGRNLDDAGVLADTALVAALDAAHRALTDVLTQVDDRATGPG